MNKTQVGRAMDVLRFVHMSLGGKDDDDLEDYYLKLSTLDKTVAAELDGSGDANNDHGKGDLDKNLGAAAGRHAEGHYTQFLDEDEERGEGQPTTDSKDISDEELEEYQSQHEELEDNYVNPQDPSILAHCSDIANAIRIAFRAPIAPAPESSSDDTTMQSIITRRHRDAIDASSLLAEQIYAWDRKSSISVNNQHGVRIVATSSCLQLSNMGGSVRVGGKKYKFAYRIRVENTNNDNNKVVQLLGRTWNIYECRHTNASLLTKLLEEGSLPSGDEEEGEEDISIRTLVQNVHEPKTGAVGHFPVIRPGEVSVVCDVMPIVAILEIKSHTCIHVHQRYLNTSVEQRLEHLQDSWKVHFTWLLSTLKRLRVEVLVNQWMRCFGKRMMNESLRPRLQSLVL
jgi:hypothetical protein